MVLFLTTCSLNKAEGGAARYDEEAAITSLLSPAVKERLLERREAVRQLVKNDELPTWGARSRRAVSPASREAVADCLRRHAA